MKYVYTFIFFSITCATLHAHNWSNSRPDGHAPIAVMGEHTHKKGEWMVSYRYMHMSMEGNRDGSSDLSSSEVHARGFAVAPTEMNMDMHMFGIMYAPSNKWTLMLMTPIVSMSMDHIMRNGRTFTTESDGIGDMSLSGLYQLMESETTKWHLNLGLSFPTGSTEERGDTPAANNVKLPYPMQLGSGTVDFLPGVTYLAQRERVSWGSQFKARFHMGDNDENYSLGNRLAFTAWFANKWGRFFSTNYRLSWQNWGNIEGADSDLNAALVPTADPNRRGGNRLDIGLGFNLYKAQGSLKGNRLAFEVLLPVYQNLDGPQLETDLSMTLGWQYAW